MEIFLHQGEYIIIFDTGSSCEPTKNHKIAFNIYFSKISFNETHLKGNITTTVPFDDTQIVSIHTYAINLFMNNKTCLFNFLNLLQEVILFNCLISLLFIIILLYYWLFYSII